MAAIKVSVVAYGFSALLVVLGAIMMMAGYYVNNSPEVSSGWALVIAGIVVWLLGWVLRASRMIK